MEPDKEYAQRYHRTGAEECGDDQVPDLIGDLADGWWDYRTPEGGYGGDLDCEGVDVLPEVLAFGFGSFGGVGCGCGHFGRGDG